MRTWAEVQALPDFQAKSPEEKKMVADRFIEVSLSQNPQAKPEEVQELRKRIYSTIEPDREENQSAFNVVDAAARKALAPPIPVGRMTASATAEPGPLDYITPGFAKFADFFGADPRGYWAKKEAEQNRFKTAEQIYEIDKKKGGILSDIFNALGDTALYRYGKSLQGPEAWREMQDVRPEWAPYQPKHENLYSMTSLLGDFPLYVAGAGIGTGGPTNIFRALTGKQMTQRIGSGAGGSFGLPAMMRVLTEKKMSGGFYNPTFKEVLSGEKPLFRDKKDITDFLETAKEITKAGVVGAGEGYAMHLAGLGTGKAIEQIGLANLFRKAGGVAGTGMTYKEFQNIFKNAAPKWAPYLAKIPALAGAQVGYDQLMQEMGVRPEAPADFTRALTLTAIMEGMGLPGVMRRPKVVPRDVGMESRYLVKEADRLGVSPKEIYQATLTGDYSKLAPALRAFEEKAASPEAWEAAWKEEGAKLKTRGEGRDRAAAIALAKKIDARAAEKDALAASRARAEEAGAIPAWQEQTLVPYLEESLKRMEGEHATALANKDFKEATMLKNRMDGTRQKLDYLKEKFKPYEEADIPVIDPRDINPLDLEWEVRMVEPEISRETAAILKEINKPQPYSKNPVVSEKINRLVNLFWDQIHNEMAVRPEMKAGIMDAAKTGSKGILDYVDTASGGKELEGFFKKKNYQDAVLKELSKRLLRTYDEETIARIEKAKAESEPYLVQTGPSSERNKEAFEATRPPTEGFTKEELAQKQLVKDINDRGSYQGSLSMKPLDQRLRSTEPEHLTKDEYETVKEMPGRSFVSDADGSAVILPKMEAPKIQEAQTGTPVERKVREVMSEHNPEEGAKGQPNLFQQAVDKGATEIIKAAAEGKPAMIEKKDFKYYRRYLSDKFIASIGRSVSKYTETGKRMTDEAYSYYRNTELRQGELISRFREGIADFAKDKVFYKKYKDVFIDLLDKGNEYVANQIKEGKMYVPVKDLERLVVMKENTRKILDEIYKEAKDIGLKEYHPNVARWKIVDTPAGMFDVTTARGELVRSFHTRKDAEKFQQEKLFTPIEYRENYFMHIIDKSKYDDPRIKRNVVQYLINKKIVSNEGEANQLLDNCLNSNEVSHGNLQVAREWELPDEILVRDLHVIEHYIETAANRIERAKAFGVKDEKIYQLALGVAKEAGEKWGFNRGKYEYDKAKLLAQAVTDRIESDADANAIANFMMNIQVVRKMTTSAIGQLPQTMAGMWRASPYYWGKSVLSLAGKNRAEMNRFVERCGINLESTRRGILGAMGGGTFASSYLHAVGFVKMDATSRVVAAVTGKFYAQHLADTLLAKSNRYTVNEKGEIYKGNKLMEKKRGLYQDYALRQMEKMDVDPRDIISSGTLSEVNLRAAARKFEVDTNFRARAIDLPAFRQSVAGKFVTQFKTFMYSQTKSIRDNIVDEARRGNVRPLLYFVLVSGVSGSVANELRGLISGRDSDWKKITEGDVSEPILDALSAAGAMGVFELGMGAKYGDPALGAMINDLFAAGRMFGAMYQAKGIGSKAYIGLKEGAKLALPLGGRWKRTIQMIHNSPEATMADWLLMPYSGKVEKENTGLKSLKGMQGLKGLNNL